MTTEERKNLFVIAPDYQGGHSAEGFRIAAQLGIPFPIRMEPLEVQAVIEGLDPAELWPWYVEMKRAQEIADEAQRTRVCAHCGMKAEFIFGSSCHDCWVNP